MRSIHRKRVIISLLPMLIMLTAVYIIPLVNVTANAFIGFTGSTKGQFVALGNFAKIAKSIPKTLEITLTWTYGSVLSATFFGLVLALLCHHAFPLRKAVISISLLPYSIPLIIVASCWRFTLSQDFGIINVFLLQLGIIDKPIAFLNLQNALGSVIVARIWRATPFAFINFYAALTAIPNELYEASAIDGAKPYQTLLHITLPSLRKVMSTTLIVLTVWTFLVFDIIYGMTGGGPVSATRIISIQIFREMFHMKDLGTASAWSLTAIIVLLLTTVLYWKLMEGRNKE